MTRGKDTLAHRVNGPRGKAAVIPEDRAPAGAGGQQLRLSQSDPVAQAAIHAGELAWLAELLHEHPGVAAARLVDDNGGSNTPLHTAAHWPGFFPHGPGRSRQSGYWP